MNTPTWTKKSQPHQKIKAAAQKKRSQDEAKALKVAEEAAAKAAEDEKARLGQLKSPEEFKTARRFHCISSPFVVSEAAKPKTRWSFMSSPSPTEGEVEGGDKSRGSIVVGGGNKSRGSMFGGAGWTNGASLFGGSGVDRAAPESDEFTSPTALSSDDAWEYLESDVKVPCS
jgi:hypothetical protein